MAVNIKMLSSQNGSESGLGKDIKLYKEGVEYTIGESLAKVFIDNRFAVKTDKTKEAVAGASENKGRKAKRSQK